MLIDAINTQKSMAANQASDSKDSDDDDYKEEKIKWTVISKSVPGRSGLRFLLLLLLLL